MLGYSSSALATVHRLLASSGVARSSGTYVRRLVSKRLAV